MIKLKKCYMTYVATAAGSLSVPAGEIYVKNLLRLISPGRFLLSCNCSAPSKIQKKNVMDACIRELFFLNFIWRIRHTEKTPVFEVGSEQLHYLI